MSLMLLSKRKPHHLIHSTYKKLSSPHRQCFYLVPIASICTSIFRKALPVKVLSFLLELDYLITFWLSAFFYSERPERALALAQWHLLIVEAEANGDSWSMKGAFHWLVRAVTRDFFPALALVSPVQNICCLTGHYFTSFVPIAQQDGQAVVPCRLSVYIYLWLYS
jgi:hypothetical protein